MSSRPLRHPRLFGVEVDGAACICGGQGASGWRPAHSPLGRARGAQLQTSSHPRRPIKRPTRTRLRANKLKIMEM